MTKLQKILHTSGYGLTFFNSEHIDTLEKSVQEQNGKFYTDCVVRRKRIKMGPEEVVRQLFLMTLMTEYGYPHDRLVVECPIQFGSAKKKADVVVMDENHANTPYIVIEFKSPEVRGGRDQLKSYCNASGSLMGVWCNGNEKICYHRKPPNYFEVIRNIPTVTETPRDVLKVAWTMDDLTKENILVQEGRSLKDVIEELENDVLANSGENTFEEVFKLILAKLYDEWECGRDKETRRTRNLRFYNTGDGDVRLKSKIQSLFEGANVKWSGVFASKEKILLPPTLLAVCVSSLDKVKLFNSNLDVMDNAFEYLISKENKSEKGQYFTPRYAIDMCVKMLDPKETEYMIDTAAGSSGFPIHTIFHVWKKILKRKNINQSDLFTGKNKPPDCKDYVRGKVFAIDFDDKAVRVSRALNLIAGDGQTNVLKLNTLDYKKWGETAKDPDWSDAYNEGEKKLRHLRVDKKDARDHQFDIVMANPPFAGDITDPQVIHLYELGRKMKERNEIKKATRGNNWHGQISRHILFIERNLQFLKPGGRMAIVLPRGIFNNKSDFPQRHFIQENCRILAVVGLHDNVFKPHTQPSTSILFVQKWNNDPKSGHLCPRKDDYNIFFATMQKPGKNNSGNNIFVKYPKKGGGSLAGQEFLEDANGRLIVDHDLFNLLDHHFPDGCEDKEVCSRLNKPSIAEAFLEFSKKEGLSFVKKD